MSYHFYLSTCVFQAPKTEHLEKPFRVDEAKHARRLLETMLHAPTFAFRLGLISHNVSFPESSYHVTLYRN